MRRLPLALVLALGAAAPALAQDAVFSGADIEAAAPGPGGGLPAGRSALTAKVQILLDRSGISPGVVDGFNGGMSETAIRAFERQQGLPIDGRLDAEVWALLQPYATEPVTQGYTITQDDAADLVAEIPRDYAEKAKMARLGYTSLAEKLGERFHMDERFVAFLNPGVTLAPGATITVMRPAKPLKGKVARIVVDKAAHRVAAYDAAGRLVVDYPATIGSTETPSPSGVHMVEAVALNPDYTYNPNINFKQGDNDKPLRIPPGPNGPVGTVWIDLDKPTYGIHGTPTPSQLFVNASHGCVRLTNWDAWELAHMVQPKVTQVEFLAPGETIPGGAVEAVASAAPAADGTSSAASAALPGRPAARPASVLLAAGGAVPAVPVEAAATATAPAAPGDTAVTPAAPDAAVPYDPLAVALDAATAGTLPVQPSTPETGSYAPPQPAAPLAQPTPTPAG